MSEHVIEGFSGLDTEQNQLDVDKGGLAVASNCAIERPGVIFPRRGLALTSTMTGYKKVWRIWTFNGTLMVHVDDNGSTRIGYVSGGVFTALSAQCADPDGADYRLHEVEASDALFVAESVGIRRYSAAATQDGFAGVPAMPDMDRGNSTTAAGTLIANNTQRAYRACLLYRPTTGPERIGAPSGRLVVRNTSGAAANPTNRILLPVSVNTASTALTAGNWWVQMFSSDNSAGVDEDPGDEMALVYEHLLTAGDIVAGYIDVTDATPYALGGSALYINASQGGSGAAKEPPSFAKCLGRYRDCLVAANTTGRQYFELSILAVLGTAGIQNTDTFNVECGANSFTVTGVSGVPGANQYRLENTGSAATDIKLTAQNLVSAINRHASNTSVYAFYAGIPDDPRTLGRIFIESRLVNAPEITPFVGTGSATACFEPQLPQTAASSAVQSTVDAFGNGWAISEPSEPDAWPPFRAGRMGAGNIIWISSLEEACFFWHDSGEVWMMSGEPGFGSDLGTLRVERKHTNLTLLAPFTAQSVDGRVLALTDRGVVALSSSGYEVLSRNIDTALRSTITTATLTTVREKSFAVVHPADRRYQLWIPSTDATTCYELNLRTGAWTTRSGTGDQPVAKTTAGGYSSSDDFIYYGDTVATTARVFQESNGQSGAAYADLGAAFASVVTLPPFVIDAGTKPKQLREVQVAFEGSQPATVTATITTEHGAGSATAVTSQSTNLCRIPVPREIQRAARHTVSLAISTNGTKWAMSSAKLIYRAYESRGSK